MAGLKRVVAIYNGWVHYKAKHGCDALTTSTSKCIKYYHVM